MDVPQLVPVPPQTIDGRVASALRDRLDGRVTCAFIYTFFSETRVQVRPVGGFFTRDS